MKGRNDPSGTTSSARGAGTRYALLDEALCFAIQGARKAGGGCRDESGTWYFPVGNGVLSEGSTEDIGYCRWVFSGQLVSQLDRAISGMWGP